MTRTHEVPNHLNVEDTLFLASARGRWRRSWRLPPRRTQSGTS
jgi:hypothetical protein